ncbi:hypothetical protein [Priestia megaterium]|uniref:hypothetical protein n=1 Tax=Priestia megaterium TaxID=1404 RepID=UPI000BFBF7A8|nr:hypothetical protein [Priestia megaterium]PGQ88163.1 hypothetical protein COA18_04365 [Priestia megaterium]
MNKIAEYLSIAIITISMMTFAIIGFRFFFLNLAIFSLAALCYYLPKVEGKVKLTAICSAAFTGLCAIHFGLQHFLSLY